MIRLPWWFPPTHVPSLDLQRSGEKYVWSVVDETHRSAVQRAKYLQEHNSFEITNYALSEPSTWGLNPEQEKP